MCNTTDERSEILDRSSTRLYVVRHRFTLIDVLRDRFIVLPWRTYVAVYRQPVVILEIYHGEYKYKIYTNRVCTTGKEGNVEIH